MSSEPPNWPPIISGAQRPAWIRWRDIAITLFMWGVFLLIVEIEFAIIWGDLPSLAGTSVYSGLGIHGVRAELRPAVWIIVLLVAILGVSTLLSRRRRARALQLAQPCPAPDDELAGDLGMTSQQLEELRRHKVITLDVNEGGKASVAPITTS